MLQYKILFIVTICTFAFLIALSIRAYVIQRNLSRKKKDLFPLEFIHAQFFPYTEKKRFEEYWPAFCKLVGSNYAYNYLDSFVPVMEIFFPFSDIYYENLETFLTINDGNIRNITIKELFDKYYQRRNKKEG